MKSPFTPLLLIALSWPAIAGAAPPEAGAKAMYDQAMAAAAKAEYVQAIPLFEKARTLFAAEKNQEGAYKSAAMATYLASEDAFLKQTKPAPTWYRSGWMLADPLYSAQFLKPNVENYPFGGLLVLAKELRRVPTPGGGSVPVNGVLDAQTVPVLQPGEQFAPDPGPCEIAGSGKPDGELAAVVNVKGHENDQVWKGIRKAWRFNPRSGRIEDVPGAQVVCRNETLGL